MIELPSFEGFLPTREDRIAMRNLIKEDVKRLIDLSDELLYVLNRSNLNLMHREVARQVAYLNKVYMYNEIRASDLCVFVFDFIGSFKKKQNHCEIIVLKFRSFVRHVLYLAHQMNDESLKKAAIQLGEIFKSTLHDSWHVKESK